MSHSFNSWRTTTSGPLPRRQYTGVTQNKNLEIRSAKPWQAWTEMSVTIEHVPSNITTWDLWTRFQGEGHILFIELFENRQGMREGRARVRFAQPPAVRPFWDGKVFLLDFEGPEIELRVVVEPQKRSFQIQSPIRRQVFYPEQMFLHPTSLNFGFMKDESVMDIMRTVTPRVFNGAATGSSMYLKLDLLRSKLEIRFPINYSSFLPPGSGTRDDTTNDFKFEVPLNQLSQICKSRTGEKLWSLKFSLESPPQFFRKCRDSEYGHDKQGKVLTWSERDIWFRKTDIISDTAILRRQIVKLDHGDPIIDFGRWTTYEVVFGSRQAEQAIFNQMQAALQDWNISVIDGVGSSETGSMSEFWAMAATPEVENSSLHDKLFLPFEVRYQLEVCISHGYFNEHNITHQFITKLADLSTQNADRARFLLEWVAAQSTRIYNPESIFTDPRALSFVPQSKIPRYCSYTRKATITPSLMYLSTPTVEISNRVVRNFSVYSDRFLRVQFTDEKAEGRISPCADKDRNEEIFCRVLRTLSNGIKIGNRHYQFLAFGNSQFRENGAYFFAPKDNLTCGAIRAWMGDFSDIMIPAKYAARLGLCFSTTRAISTVRPNLKTFDDVERNGCCFTDGVGKISNLLALVISNELQLPGDGQAPSAFQFRMGGCKGMLVAWPDVVGFDIWIRKSQQKFTAIYNGLEIIRWSRFSTATLNRQTITILSALGVADEVFNMKLMEQLANYQKAMEDTKFALELLSRYIDENHITITIAGMVLDGFMSSREPFLMSLLHLWRSWSIKLLKEKAKIIIEEGAFLLGVTDESGKLKGHIDGPQYPSSYEPRNVANLPEIFLQITDRKKKGHFVVVQGLCIIGRNPSLHPGDVRVVVAVDIPELHHLRDVVVFSQNGDRDVPGMCSGGDLDGDDFFVLWDKELLPTQWNHPPMNYTAPTPTTLDRQVKITDLMKFFVKYMKNDSLPTIAHAHLAQTDFLDLGPMDRRCLELADLHSKAVDYVKTGVAATMGKHLRPRKWPHFMEKKFKPKEQQYVSHKILGQLYDKVEHVGFVPQYEEHFDRRILDAYPMDDILLKAARHMKTKYDEAMLRLMAQHEIKTEFEIWSTFVLSKPRVGSDYKMQEEMGIVSSTLKTRFKSNIIEYSGGNSFDQLAPFVAAMYRVTFEEMQFALNECHSTKMLGGREVPRRKMEPRYMPLMSFPWLFHDILGRIASGSESRHGLENAFVLSNHGFKRRQPDADNVDETDIVHTEQGVIHRGEQLDLFHAEDLDEDGDHIEHCMPKFETHVDVDQPREASGDNYVDVGKISCFDNENTKPVSATSAKLAKEDARLEEREAEEEAGEEQREEREEEEEEEEEEIDIGPISTNIDMLMRLTAENLDL